jgi:hypothetical protein
MERCSMTTYDLIRQDIIDGDQVTCLYKGLYRECCPHIIGQKNGRQHVQMFQFAGESSRGLPPNGEWRCMNIDEISEVVVQEGHWYTDLDYSPSTDHCIDVIDLNVPPSKVDDRTG